MTTISSGGLLEIHHDDVLVTRQQISGQFVSHGNVLICATVDGVPCVVVATWGEGSGVYIHHALTGQLMRSLPFDDDVYCLCVDRSGLLVVFGTVSGLWFRMACTIRCYR